MHYLQKITVICMVTVISLCTVLGCSAPRDEGIDLEQLLPYISATNTITYPTNGIIALGEATHGNREFVDLKLQTFQQLVTQHDARVFAIEGDFGGSQKVNAYLQTGKGSAEQAAGEIGFAIYRTSEMADILEWMRTFNINREPGDQIRFYGFDMQRYDNNKEGLFAVLKTASPQLYERYANLLSDVTNDTMYDLDQAAVEHLLSELKILYTRLEADQELIVSATSEASYDLACQYAKCIEENTQLRSTGQYGTLRDRFMAEHVQWIAEYEEKYYGSQLIFITGHNSHIGKTNATMGTQKSMGEILKEWYGSQYFAIGTEFHTSTFLAPDAGSNERREFTVQNSGTNRLAVLLSDAEMEVLYLDVTGAAKNDPDAAAYLAVKQSMSAIGETFADSYAQTEMMYTQKLSIAETYDGIIFVRSATPVHMLPE